MKSYIISLLFIVFVFGCNQNSSQYEDQILYEDTSTYPKQKLSLDIFKTEAELLKPRRIWLNDTLLIINDNGYTRGFLSFYSRNSGSLVIRYGETGEGPGEYMNPRYTKIKDSLIIFSVNRKCTFLSLRDIRVDSLPRIVEYEELKDKSHYSSNYFFPICDNLIVLNQISENQYILVDNRINISKKINNFPDLPGEKVSDFNLNTAVFDAFYSIKPNKTCLVAAYKYYPILDIIQLPDFSTKRVVFKNKMQNRYAAKDQLNIEFEDPMIQYTFSYCTDQYIYLLYQNANRSDLKNNKQISEIHVFDWNANLVKMYVVDKAIYNFAITDANDYLYALGLDDELDPQIYTCALDDNKR